MAHCLLAKSCKLNSKVLLMARLSSGSLSLLSLDEGTLLEVFVRLGVADLANTASSCALFANMCRSEWLWRQLSALRGIRILDPPGHGWRSMYIALCRVDTVGWSPLLLNELKRLCKLFQSFSIPAGHNLVCIELDLSCLEEPSSQISPATLASADGAGSFVGAETASRIVNGRQQVGSFRFASERWACTLTSHVSEDEQPSAALDQHLPTVSVRLSRIESTLASCESSKWFHILSAQAHLLLPEQDSIGPITNGIVALGKVPAGLQMHVDLPEVRQKSSAFPCSTWEHEDEVSVSGVVHREIVDLLARHVQSLKLPCEGSLTPLAGCNSGATQPGRALGHALVDATKDRGLPQVATVTGAAAQQVTGGRGGRGGGKRESR